MAIEFTRKRRKKIKGWIKQALNDKVDCLQRRSELKRMIEDNAENGQVAIVYGFTDCDGGFVDNLVRVVNASVIAVEHWETDFLRDAEGQTWWAFARPSSVTDLEEEHRDLALEAFEDGHPHVLYLT